MNAVKNAWAGFAEKHPGASKWIREGGLFVIVSNLITVLKYLMLFGHLIPPELFLNQYIIV